MLTVGLGCMCFGVPRGSRYRRGHVEDAKCNSYSAGQKGKNTIAGETQNTNKQEDREKQFTS